MFLVLHSLPKLGGNVGRDKSVANSPNVDLNKGTDGGVDRDGAFAENYTQASHTGTTATTELRNGLIKAGTLSVGEKVRITANGTVAGTAGQKTIALRCKGASNRGVTFPATAEGPFTLDIEITAKDTSGGATGSQVISGTVFCGTDFGTVFAEENGETDLIDYNLRLAVKLFDTSDTINVEAFRVEYS